MPVGRAIQTFVLSPSERVPVTAGPSLVGRSPHRSGRGVLEVRSVAGQSAATSVWAESPFKLLVPRSRGASVWAYLSSFGGGLVAGDETSLDVSVGLEARCFVGSQASTKVYRNPTQRPCTHEVMARVAAGGMLIYAPDPVQCFADSRYHQRQSFYLEPGSDLMVLDGLSGGRAACGERWAFSHFSSRNEVFWDHQPLWLDALRLDPAEGSLSSSARLGRFNSIATVAWFGDRLKPMSDVS